MRRKLPVVFVDQRPQRGVASVNVDDRGGARLAAQHVIDLGHRRVGVLNATADGAPAAGEDPLAGVRGYPPRQRMLGWLDALRPAGISPAVAHTPNDSIEEAAQAARSLLELKERPTAVLCFSDVLALGVLRAASALGLHVPGDTSVVGFDDSPAAQDSDPPLTTVRQDVTEKGRLAARALTEAMEGGRTGRPARVRHLVLPVELVVRAAPRAERRLMVRRQRAEPSPPAASTSAPARGAPTPPRAHAGSSPASRSVRWWGRWSPEPSSPLRPTTMARQVLQQPAQAFRPRSPHAEHDQRSGDQGRTVDRVDPRLDRPDGHLRSPGRGPGRRHRVRAVRLTATSSPTITSSTAPPTSPSSSATVIRSPPTVVAADPGSDLAVLHVDRNDLAGPPARRLRCPPGGRPGRRHRQRPRPLRRADRDHRHRVGQGPQPHRAQRRAPRQPLADRHRDQPGQLRRPAARPPGQCRRHQHRDRRTGPEHRLRHRHQPGAGDDRPAARRTGARRMRCSACPSHRSSRSARAALWSPASRPARQPPPRASRRAT